MDFYKILDILQQNSLQVTQRNKKDLTCSTGAPSVAILPDHDWFPDSKMVEVWSICKSLSTGVVSLRSSPWEFQKFVNLQSVIYPNTFRKAASLS